MFWETLDPRHRSLRRVGGFDLLVRALTTEWRRLASTLVGMAVVVVQFLRNFGLTMNVEDCSVKLE